MNFLILPGHGGSGTHHWQTIWEMADDRFRRVEQKDWINVVCKEWVDALESAVKESGPRTILVAHSLACLQVAHWAEQTKHIVKAAFLVAPPDPGDITFPETAVGFDPVPMKRFSFPSIVISSQDDPFDTLGFGRKAADAWGGEFLDLGAAGHVNVESGYGAWPNGRRLLESLV